jgi:hypothetical protein
METGMATGLRLLCAVLKYQVCARAEGFEPSRDGFGDHPAQPALARLADSVNIPGRARGVHRVSLCGASRPVVRAAKTRA